MDHLRAVLFDFGGVFTGTPLVAFRDAAAEFGLSPDVMTDLIIGPRDRDGEHPWHRLERGEIGVSSAVAEITRLALDVHAIELDPMKVLIKTPRSSEDRALMIDRVRALRGVGLQTAIVTNNFKEIGELWRKAIPVELFDVVIDSSEVGIRKPDPRIYQLTAQRLNDVDPTQCAFLDDLTENVAGAQSVGMTGILVGEDKATTFEWLDALLAVRRKDTGGVEVHDLPDRNRVDARVDPSGILQTDH